MARSIAESDRTVDVAVFVRSLEGGGAERVASQLANAFAHADLRVDLVVQFRRGPYLEDLDAAIKVVEIGHRLRMAIPWICRYLRRRKPTAVLSLLTENNVAMLVGAFVSSYKGRVVVSERNSMLQPRHIPSWMVRSVVRYLYPRAHRVVALSSEMVDELVTLGLARDRVVAIPNPVNVEQVSSFAGEAPDHDFFSAGVPVLVAVGRLVAQKDYPTLLRAASLLRPGYDFRLLILGDGEERENLEKLTTELGLQRLVDFPGFKDHPWPWISRSDLLVLSSRFEGWPNVLAEALALGVRVVSTDCPTGPRELLDDGRFGTLVPVNDPSALANAIIAALAGPHEPELLRLRANEWAVECIAPRYLEVLGLARC